MTAPRAGPLTRLTQGAEAQTAAIQQQTDMLQANLQMMAEHHDALTSVVQLMGHLGEMIQQTMTQMRAESARLMTALTAPKHVQLNVDEHGKATGATVRPAVGGDA